MSYFDRKKQLTVLNRRTFFIYLSKLIIFSIVGWRLFNIQVTNSGKYRTLSKNNQINIEILYPLRGEIRDRKEQVIATNIKVFDLYVIPEKTSDLSLTLNNLSKFIDLNFKQKREIIQLSKKIKKFEKIKIIENLDWKTLEFIEVNKNYLTGLELIQDFQRVYPESQYFSHILGYVNQPSKKDLRLPYILKMPKLNIGQQGLEKSFNENLIGKAGNREIEVNSLGRTIREISKQMSTKGENITLTFDIGLQKYLHKQLSNHRAGSIVVIDIVSGDILSMASVPTYDSNLIIKKPNYEYWQELLNNPLSPLTDRSIQGMYSPGSTFKMIVAIAALKHNIINSKNNFFCTGKISFGDRFFHCWKTKGHGKMNLEQAIQESCDVFFYELSIKVGIDKIAEVAKDFGLGQIYPINIDNQKKGIVPSKKWKKEVYNKKWYGGETLITAIGQGYLLATPLQMAVMTARIASGGKKILPSIIRSSEEKKFDIMKKYSNGIKIVQKAMFKVVNEKKGTANQSKSNDFQFSGKTGTSQVRKISMVERESEDFRNIEIEWKNRDHALFVGYMPSNKPQYSISVVIEHGGSGASTAAPIARDVFNYINKTNIT